MVDILRIKITFMCDWFCDNIFCCNKNYYYYYYFLFLNAWKLSHNQYYHINKIHIFEWSKRGWVCGLKTKWFIFSYFCIWTTFRIDINSDFRLSNFYKFLQHSFVKSRSRSSWSKDRQYYVLLIFLCLVFLIQVDHNDLYQ